MKSRKLILGASLLASLVACRQVAQKSKAIIVKMADENNATYAKEIEKNTPVNLADGLKINIWATDSLAIDPIAMSIDDQNRIFLTRTNRQKNSEFDIRGHRDWMTESISLQSVEDRRAFLRKIFDPQNSDKNEYLKDLNNDGSHDWRDLAIEQEEIWRLEDTDGDGLADRSTQVLKDFNEEITDVAGALLIRKNDAFVGLGPDMWRIEDTDGDGLYDKKTSISHGWNVHIGFGGHGMSGLVEGPDGKIYWGIGDPGVNIIDNAGNKHFYPNQGVIVRCNPDGSDFEVYSHGHRNTHEFVFNEYGDLISSDNDGDHPGESERLVHLVEGSDSGWRINWQFGKYTDPKNNGYKVWMDERMYKPRWEGQAAYFIPPIMNYHNGPTGMVYNPGTALGKKWLNKYFLVEFTGTPSRAHIWSFDLRPTGASYDLKNEVDMVNGVLATGIRFGTDGALYVADWVNGWNTKNYGRIWKVDVNESSNDLAAERVNTKLLMELDYAKVGLDSLQNLLSYDDQRIRQKVQFELVNRGEAGAEVFKKVLAKNRTQLGRIHAIWGLGQLLNQNASLAEELQKHLGDIDKEVVAQIAKTLGQYKVKNAAAKLLPLLNDPSDRVKFFAAQALGRMEAKEGVPGLLALLEKNNDKDVYMRHAATLALSRIGDKAPIYQLVNHPMQSMRTAAVLVLRKWRDPKLADFLNDPSEYVVAEAARAINDDWSVEEALPALANLINKSEISSEVILRRAINASLRVGGDKQLNDLLAFAERKGIADAMRAEALSCIGVWAEPSVLDRVDGRFRGAIKRDAEKVRNLVIPKMNKFLDSEDEKVLAGAMDCIKLLEITGFNQTIASIYQKQNNAQLKVKALETLGTLKYSGIADLVKDALQDKRREVRTAGLGMLNEISVDKDQLPEMVNAVMQKGSQREQQQLIQSLGKMPVDNTRVVLEDLIARVKLKKFPSEVLLDLTETVEKTGDTNLIGSLEDARPKGSLMEQYADALNGGDRREGARYFNNNSTGQCVRCHAINGEGGTVGPDLSNIGNVLSREQLLQAMIEPSARLSPGYGTVSLTLKDGQEVTGILSQEHDDKLIIKTTEAEPLEIAKSRIANRENYPSGMPVMTEIMSKREMRDVVEFLSNLRK